MKLFCHHFTCRENFFIFSIFQHSFSVGEDRYTYTLTTTSQC
jgi:hypothetical protein